MSEVNMRFNCGECGAELEESPSLPTEERTPCPTCGSITRAIQVSISESVTIREKLGMKGSTRARRSHSLNQYLATTFIARQENG
jgi:DNA-directed RNA polymerase subunit RPC12/RpoP